MSTLIIILLAIIAYLLWCIYRQHEDEKRDAAIEKFQTKQEQEKKDLENKYPHLVGKLEGNWLEVFAMQAERGVPLLKLAFLLYLSESTKIDYSEGSLKWDAFWDLSEELLEHLDKFHEGSIAEHEIAVVTYWQIAAEAVGELIKKNLVIEGGKLEVEPYTDITKIVSLFPKKANHPAKEISFSNEKGSFPRESKGSAHVKEKLRSLGL